MAEYEKKFKAGNLVFYPPYGFKILYENGNEDWGFPFVILGFVNGVHTFTEDGKRNKHNSYPSIFTLEEAKLLGYKPPKKKVKKTFYVPVIGRVLDKAYRVGTLYNSKEEALKLEYDKIDSLVEQVVTVQEFEFEVEE